MHGANSESNLDNTGNNSQGEDLERETYINLSSNKCWIACPEMYFTLHWIRAGTLDVLENNFLQPSNLTKINVKYL